MKTFSILFIAASILFITFGANAAEPDIWTINNRSDVIKGDLRGASVDSDGRISTAPVLNEIFKTGQQYIWSSVADNSGNIYTGTGGNGHIYKIDRNGKGTLFADLEELNVSALAMAPNGDLFAATSPDGKVYRIDATGKAAVYFEPKEKYIWSLAVAADGSLYAGTGENGKIYRIRNANSSVETSLFYDTSESHIITLKLDRSGNLLAGTDSNGLLLRFDANGKPFALIDSPLREIHDIAVGSDGSIYALAIGDSVSTAPVPTPTPANRLVAKERTAQPQPPPAPKSRYDLTGARSAVYRILPNNSFDIIWASSTVTGFSIAAKDQGVILGTSDRGRIFMISDDGRETMGMQTDAGQISTIIPAGQGYAATSSNQGSVYRFGLDAAAEGTYESPVLDTGSHSQWGRIWSRSSGNVKIQTRSGNTEDPSESWSEWIDVANERGVTTVKSPSARFLQWRAVMKGVAAQTHLDEVRTAYLPQNIAPEILAITLLPANVGLAANPAMVIDPNIELTGMDPAIFGMPVQMPPPRKVYQRGAVSLQWTAEDRNSDKLVFDVYYKELRSAEYKLLKENTAENFITIDGLSLADGNYLLKVVVKDNVSNPQGRWLSGERISETFSVDNTQPVVSLNGQPQITGNNAFIKFNAVDESSYLVRAEYSVNGGHWMAVYADDGISDSPSESYTVNVDLPKTGEYSVTIRVFDSVGNIGNAAVTVKR